MSIFGVPLDEVITSIIVYLVSWIFFAMLGGASLNYYTIVSKVKLSDLEHFLAQLHFPFREVATGFYNKPYQKQGKTIYFATLRGTFFGQLFGSFLPSLFIYGVFIDLVKYEHPSAERVFLVIEIAVYSFTLITMWRFGHKLLDITKRKK